MLKVHRTDTNTDALSPVENVQQLVKSLTKNPPPGGTTLVISSEDSSKVYTVAITEKLGRKDMINVQLKIQELDS